MESPGQLGAFISSIALLILPHLIYTAKAPGYHLQIPCQSGNTIPTPGTIPPELSSALIPAVELVYSEQFVEWLGRLKSLRVCDWDWSVSQLTPFNLQVASSGKKLSEWGHIKSRAPARSPVGDAEGSLGERVQVHPHRHGRPHFSDILLQDRFS